MPSENYIVRRLNTNTIQILHNIRPKKFVPNQPLGNNFREERLQQDEVIAIPQDNLYTITWETIFGEQLATRDNEPIPTSMPNGEGQITSDSISTYARKNEFDYIFTTGSPNDVNHVPKSQNERMTTQTTEVKPLKLQRLNTLIGRIRRFTTKIEKNDTNFLDDNSSNINDAQESSKSGMIISCPKSK